MNELTQIGGEMKRLRKVAKMSQEAVAGVMGVRTITVGRWERTGRLGTDQLIRYLGVIGVTITEFWVASFGPLNRWEGLRGKYPLEATV